MKLSCWEKSRRGREQSEKGRKVRGEQEREGEPKSKAAPGRDTVSDGGLKVSVMKKDAQRKQQSFSRHICADSAWNHRNEGTIFSSLKIDFLMPLILISGMIFWCKILTMAAEVVFFSLSLIDLLTVLCVGTRRIYFSFRCLILVSSMGLSWPSQMLIFILQKLWSLSQHSF